MVTSRSSVTGNSIYRLRTPVKRNSGYTGDMSTASPAAPPDGLATIREFINTGDLDRGEEHLGDPGVLAAWLAERDLAAPGEAWTRADLTRTIQLREALRALAAANAGESASPDALAAIERQRKRSRLGVVFGDDGSAPIVP